MRVGSPSAAGSSGASWFSQRGKEHAVVRVGSPSAAGSSGASWFSQRGRGWWYVLALPARQGAAVRPIASPSVSQRDREQFSQRGREQRYVPLRLPARQGAVLPARQGTVVRVGSPSAAGSSGTSLILILLFGALFLIFFGLCFLMTSVSPTSGLLVPRCKSDSAGRFIRVECGI